MWRMKQYNASVILLLNAKRPLCFLCLNRMGALFAALCMLVFHTFSSPIPLPSIYQYFLVRWNGLFCFVFAIIGFIFFFLLV